MAKFHSPTYKSLRVADIGVRFVDGFYETKSKGEVARLRGLAGLGVVEVKPDKAPAPETELALEAGQTDPPSPVGDDGIPVLTDTVPERETAPEAPKRKSRTA